MIPFPKLICFPLTGLAMGILNLAIVIPQVITLFDVFSWALVQSYSYFESSPTVNSNGIIGS